MIKFGFILGTPLPTSGAGGQLSLLNGNPVTSNTFYLQSMISKIAPRNVGIYH
jgi:hypothetical protein